MTFLKSSHFFPYAVTFLNEVEAAAISLEEQDLSLFTPLRDPQLALLRSLASSQKSHFSAGVFLGHNGGEKIVVLWTLLEFYWCPSGVSRTRADLIPDRTLGNNVRSHKKTEDPCKRHIRHFAVLRCKILCNTISKPGVPPGNW